MEDKILIYGKAGWPYTDKARSDYSDNSIYYDVKEDSSKLDEMLRHSKGDRKVPVIVDGDKVTVGYGGSWGV